MDSAPLPVPTVTESALGMHEFALLVGIKPVPVTVTLVDCPANHAAGTIEATVGVVGTAQGVMSTYPGAPYSCSRQSPKPSDSRGARGETAMVNVIVVELTYARLDVATYGSSW